MLTPHDIQTKGFNKAVFGGYDMNAVDAFLEEVQMDFETLSTENASLRSRVKALENEVNGYHETEASMRIALATAKKTSDDMIREAEEKRRVMLDMANEEYGRKFAELNEQLLAEQDRLARACADTDKYIAAVRRLAEKQEEYLSGLRQVTDEYRPDIPVSSIPEPVDDSALPTIPDLDDLDDADTATAEEINTVVSDGLGEEEPLPDIPETVEDATKVIPPKEKKNWDKSKDDKFDFLNMQFNK